MADSLTDRQWSSVWGSLAILTSVFATLPALRRFAIPVAAYVGLWTAFNVGRALSDAVEWRDRTVDRIAALESVALAGESSSRWAQRLTEPMPGMEWIRVGAVAVYLSFFLVPHVAAIVLLIRDRTRFWRLLSALSVLFFLGLIGFALLPTNPPWIAEEGAVDRVVPSVLAEFLPSSSRAAANGSHAGHSFEPNPVASWPSIHLGVTALLIPLAASHRLRCAAIVYTVAMGACLLFLGEHYALDVVAGGLAAIAAWALSTRLSSNCSRHRPRTPAVRTVGRRHRSPARLAGVAGPRMTATADVERRS